MRRINYRIASLLLALLAAATGTSASAAEGCPLPAELERERWKGQAQWIAIEAAGLEIGSIEVEVLDVFVADDGELAWYQEFANDVHVDSRRHAIDALLTVGSGDAVEARRIYEAERVLRRREFLKDARAIPLRCADGKVDMLVRVRDAWTLKLSVGVGSAGGETTSNIGIEERNFLGSGKGIALMRNQGLTRRETSFRYSDPSVFGSEWILGYEYRDLSDGKGSVYGLARPVRRLDQEWAFAFSSEDTDQLVDFYADGDSAYTAQQSIRSSNYEARYLLDIDGTAGWRGGFGLRHDRQEFSQLVENIAGIRPAPDLVDRDLRGPFLSVERFHEDFASFTNIRSMEHPEDFNFGLTSRLVIGRFTDQSGGGNGEFGSLEIRKASEFMDFGLALMSLDLSARHHHAGNGSRWKAGYGSLVIDTYYPTTGRDTWVLHLEMDWRDRADPEDELTLGGLEGLYGYPQHHRVGDQRWRLHGEYRYNTDIVLFDTLKIGYAAFAEAGRIKQLDNRWSPLYSDVGIGLRIGNLRSAFADTYYMAIVAPLHREAGVEDYQFVIGNVIEF